ncbi:MAG: ArsA family ATPase [Candidatus Aenigmarchaeota archaeon]|nr:ArsA family ATPase [Candidatus Aenigmarchaeota archaeon]
MQGPEYLFFSGKGGVGKTSLAAATALQLAREGKRVLIVSIDPAHSLADSFAQRIGPATTLLEKNLWGVEIDPAQSMASLRERLAPRMEGMGMLKGLGMEGALDIAGMTPGIDEVAAFEAFVSFLEDERYDCIVFDTAPTGHALRFLSLPDVLDSWIGKVLAIRQQLQGMLGMFRKLLGDEPAGTGDYLEVLKERIARAREVLTDPARTHFILVLIPEAMSVLESRRALRTLEGHRIPVERVMVNQLLPPGGCGLCAQRRRQQQARLQEIRKAFRLPVAEVTLLPEEVRGKRMLTQVGTMIRAQWPAGPALPRPGRGSRPRGRAGSRSR